MSSETCLEAAEFVAEAPGNVRHARSMMQAATIVTFDVDATVLACEGLDELAAFIGKADEVAVLTQQAMAGAMPFEDALAARLSILQLTRAQLSAFLHERTLPLVPGVQALIQALQARGVAVHCISGGFTDIILPAITDLDIPATRVHANRFVFGEDGRCTGHDASALTSRSGGKAQTLASLREAHPGAVIVHIGDGATDCEAVGIADAFIGFGGVQARASVRAAADAFVYRMQDIQAWLVC